MFEKKLAQDISHVLKNLYNLEINPETISFQKTRKEFEGDTTLVVFPYTKASGTSPENTAKAIGEALLAHSTELTSAYNVVKGFLNISINKNYWQKYFANFKPGTTTTSPKNITVEYSSPNTNKPLHLGHVRNNLLGYSVAQILKAVGHNVTMVNLVNDRGIHICKSMLAWKLYGANETPESSKLKGDHLVGKYYVEFDKHYKKEIAELIEKGITKEEAEKAAPLMKQAQEMLRKWEQGDKEVIDLWTKMNSWVYDGFKITYKKMGVAFDKTYYESKTYLLGKEIIQEGLDKKVFFKKENGAVAIDLTSDGLDEKILLRSDGTSVYMTQDLGTAVERAKELNFEKMVYVVGNEQDYHFKVLQKVLDKLGYNWAQGIYHLSYGMVELPHGKMKSREGTVVDADDLIDEMVLTAKQMTQELGKADGLNEVELEQLYTTIGMGALKYFILKIDPKKKMLFNPEESVDFNGNTGPFIQYSYARIQSILRKADYKTTLDYSGYEFNAKEHEIIKSLYGLQQVMLEAGENYSPALVANYIYDLAKEFNQFYHDYSVLKEEVIPAKNFRIELCYRIGETIKYCMNLMGITVPERM